MDNKERKSLLFDLNDYDSRKTFQLLTSLGHGQTKFIVNLVTCFMKENGIYDKSSLTKDEIMACMSKSQEKSASQNTVFTKEQFADILKNTIGDFLHGASPVQEETASAKSSHNADQNVTFSVPSEPDVSQSVEDTEDVSDDRDKDIDDGMVSFLGAFM